jgi:hypothetical protein
MKPTNDTKTFAFTTTPYAHTSPARDKLTAETKIFNVALTLDQALKLQLGLQEGIRHIARYKENSEAGRRAAVNLAIHLHVGRIAVCETKLPKQAKQPR